MGWAGTGSNRRPCGFQPHALPTELPARGRRGRERPRSATAVPTGFEPATSALTGPLTPARLAVTHLHDPWESVKKAQLSARLGTALRACYHTVCTALPRCLRTQNAAAVLPDRAVRRSPSDGARCRREHDRGRARACERAPRPDRDQGRGWGRDRRAGAVVRGARSCSRLAEPRPNGGRGCPASRAGRGAAAAARARDSGVLSRPDGPHHTRPASSRPVAHHTAVHVHRPKQSIR